MKYHFSINSYLEPNSGKPNTSPLISIENQENYGWFFIDEIINLSTNLDYVKEIVTKLEALINGEIEFYEGFGYEMYMIECDKENAQVKNIYEDDKVEAIIPTEEIYELMRDWRDYLINYYEKS
jgi:hypothetical protein